MLRISEFSKLSRVSIRMLRHYDDIGLLQSVEIDRFTGYRYYAEEQLTTIGRITSLKDMGFSLADIIRILDVYDEREKLDTYFARRQQELAALSRETAYQMTLLDTARKRLESGKAMNYNVSIRTIPERYAATVCMTIPHYEDEAIAWKILCEETESLHVIPANPCLVAASYLDKEFKEDHVGIMVWKTVKGTYPDTEHVTFQTLPEVKVASCTIVGSYEQLTDCYAAVYSWAKENGHESAGALFNIYYVSPHETQNPDEFVTEVCFAVK